MAANKEQIILEFISDAKGAVKDVRVLNKSMKDFDDQAKKGTKSSTGLFQSLKKIRAGWLAGAAALTGLIAGMTKAVRLAGAQELAEKKLAAALKNVKTATEGGAQSLIKLAAALQKTTSYADDNIINAQAMLATFQLNEKQIAELTPRLLDMAASVSQLTGAQADLQSIAIALGKGITGQTGVLARYGVVLAEDTKETKDFNLILRDLDNNFKGIAEESAQSILGTLRTLGNVVGDTLEKTGKFAFEGLRPLAEGAIALLTPTEELIDKSVRLGATQLNAADNTFKLIDRYEELATNTNRTAAENAEFVKVSKALAMAVPEAAESVDELTGAYKINTTEARKAASANRDFAEATLEIEAGKLTSEIDGLTRAIAKNKDRQAALTNQVRALNDISQRLKDGTVSASTAFIEMNVAVGRMTGEFAGAAFEGSTLQKQLKRLAGEKANLQGRATALATEEEKLNAKIETLIGTYDRLVEAGIEVEDSTRRMIELKKEQAEEAAIYAEWLRIQSGEEVAIDEAAAARQEEKLLKMSEYYAYIGQEEFAALQTSIENQEELLASTNLTEEQRLEIMRAGELERETIEEAFATKQRELATASFDMFNKTFDELTKSERKSVLERISAEEEWAKAVDGFVKQFGSEFGKTIGATIGALISGTEEAKKSFKEMVDDMVKQMTKKAFVEGLSMIANVLLPGSGSFFGGIAQGLTGGFAEGGYTGDKGRNEVAGVVHGGEYVMKADVVNAQSKKFFDMINYGKLLPSRGRAGYQDGGLVAPSVGGGSVGVTVNVSGLDKAQWDELTRDQIVPALERTLNDLNRSIFTAEDIA